jgi:hypothetical protein
MRGAVVQEMTQTGAAHPAAHGEITPEPGVPRDEAVRQALVALRLDWGWAYQVGRDDEHGWWAARHGQVGQLLKADGPDELRAGIAGDYEPWLGETVNRGNPLGPVTGGTRP